MIGHEWENSLESGVVVSKDNTLALLDTSCKGARVLTFRFRGEPGASSLPNRVICPRGDDRDKGLDGRTDTAGRDETPSPSFSELRNRLKSRDSSTSKITSYKLFDCDPTRYSTSGMFLKGRGRSKARLEFFLNSLLLRLEASRRS